MRSTPSARQLRSHAARKCFARPSGSQRPSGRVIPPLVATVIRDRSPDQVDSARSISRSLCPRSRSSRQYASAVSSSVTPASNAAWSTAIERSSSRSGSVDRRMQPIAMGRASGIAIILWAAGTMSKLITALRRGLRKRCPHCGEGRLFSGWSNLERCAICGLVFQRNPGDTWAFTIIGDRLPIGVMVVLIYFGVVRLNALLGVTMLVVLAALLFWTAPNRWGAGIALHYLSRVYWPDPADPIPPPPPTDPRE